MAYMPAKMELMCSDEDKEEARNITVFSLSNEQLFGLNVFRTTRSAVPPRMQVALLAIKY